MGEKKEKPIEMGMFFSNKLENGKLSSLVEGRMIYGDEKFTHKSHKETDIRGENCGNNLVDAYDVAEKMWEECAKKIAERSEDFTKAILSSIIDE